MTSYELGDMLPRTRALYDKLAEVLGVNVNYLLTDDNSIATHAVEQCDGQVRVEVITILNETRELLTDDVLTHGERKEI